MRDSLLEKLKYNYKIIRKNWRDKFFWKSVIVNYLVSSYYKKFKTNDGIYVMKEDWDNLIILDDCRYDLFVELTGINCNYKISRGSSTPEFLKENFANHKYEDTIYITANPQVNKYVKDSFSKVVSIWKTNWDEELNTVLPESVVEHSLKMEEEYPDKRLIIHFMQPHIPFIKDPELNWIGYGDRSTFRIFEDKNWEQVGQIPCNPWKEVGRGNIDLDTVYNAYKRNLEAVLPHALRLAGKLKGKTAITADHGQAINDRAPPFPIKILDHPSHVYIPALVKVPWLVFESKKRKTVRKVKEGQRIKKRVNDIKGKKKI